MTKIRKREAGRDLVWDDRFSQPRSAHSPAGHSPGRNRHSQNRTTPMQVTEHPDARFFTTLFKLDGIIHDRNAGWQDGRMYGPPIPGALEVLRAELADPGRAVVIATQRTNLGDVVRWLDGHGISAFAEDRADRQYWKVPHVALVTRYEIFADLRVLKPAVVEFTGDWEQVRNAARAGAAALSARFDVPLGTTPR